MTPPTTTQSRFNEDEVFFAVSALNSQQLQSQRAAASIFGASRRTVRRRRDGIAARRDCQPNSKKLSKLEEEVITEYILDLDTRGVSPTLGAVRDMADKLLAERGASQVGTHWPHNFVKQTESLTRRFNRPHDCQRALCEDPRLSRPGSSW